MNQLEENYPTYIRRLTCLLESSSPSRFPDTKLRTLPYGDHVREILIGLTNPTAIIELLESICHLVPNLLELSSLRIAQLPNLPSPRVIFPKLQSFNELNATPIRLSLTERCRRELSHDSRITAEESFLSLLNHHPLLSRVSCRGLRIDSSRLVNVLRSSLLSVPYVRQLKEEARTFVGLRSLHLGLDCVVDVELLDALPSAAPALEQLSL